MTTTKTALKIEEAVKIVKPFIGSLAGKDIKRLALKTALVTEDHVIATDSHALIRLKHEGTEKPFLHHYKKLLTGAHDVDSYPKTEKLIPDPYNAQKTITINVKEWLEAHENAAIAAKEHKNNTVNLSGNKIRVDPAYKKAVKGRTSDYSSIMSMKGYKDVPVHEFDQISFNYTLDQNTEIDRLSYSAVYMVMMLKVAKKLKQKEITMHFYGSLRPMYFVGENMEVIILPIRNY